MSSRPNIYLYINIQIEKKDRFIPLRLDNRISFQQTMEYIFDIEIDLLKVVRSPFNRAGSLLFLTSISLFQKLYSIYIYIASQIFFKVGFLL